MADQMRMPELAVLNTPQCDSLLNTEQSTASNRQVVGTVKSSLINLCAVANNKYGEIIV